MYSPLLILLQSMDLADLQLRSTVERQGSGRRSGRSSNKKVTAQLQSIGTANRPYLPRCWTHEPVQPVQPVAPVGPVQRAHQFNECSASSAPTRPIDATVPTGCAGPTVSGCSQPHVPDVAHQRPAARRADGDLERVDAEERPTGTASASAAAFCDTSPPPHFRTDETSSAHTAATARWLAHFRTALNASRPLSPASTCKCLVARHRVHSALRLTRGEEHLDEELVERDEPVGAALLRKAVAVIRHHVRAHQRDAFLL
eukprot:gene10326-biopygen6378